MIREAEKHGRSTICPFLLSPRPSPRGGPGGPAAVGSLDISCQSRRTGSRFRNRRIRSRFSPGHGANKVRGHEPRRPRPQKKKPSSRSVYSLSDLADFLTGNRVLGNLALPRGQKKH